MAVEGVATIDRPEDEGSAAASHGRRWPKGVAVAVGLTVLVGAVAVGLRGSGDDGGAGRHATRLVTPVERAEAGDYVAVGDSFSSGEGAGDYEDGDCRRSSGAHPVLVGGRFDFDGDVVVETCTGARASDALLDQVDAVTGDASLVTIGIGGNDADWSAVVLQCWWEDADGCEGDDAEVHERIDQAAGLAGQVYRLARADAGDDARVVAVGYPRLFPAEPDDDFMDRHPACLGVHVLAPVCLTRTISPREQRYMNDLVRSFNERLAAEAAGAGAEFLDLTDAFDGHELTTDDARLHGLVLDWPDCPPVTWGCVASALQPESLHPTAAGQERMADLLEAHIRYPWVLTRPVRSVVTARRRPPGHPGRHRGSERPAVVGVAGDPPPPG